MLVQTSISDRSSNLIRDAAAQQKVELAGEACWRTGLARYLREHRLNKGVELGVKRGRSLQVLLRLNPELDLTGIDVWKSAPAYRFPMFDYLCAWVRTLRFTRRARLIKAEADKAAKCFADHSLDFVHYDVFNYRISTVAFHEVILRAWLPKLRVGGRMIGRDFGHQHVHEALEKLGLGDLLMPMNPNDPALAKVHVVVLDSYAASP